MVKLPWATKFEVKQFPKHVIGRYSFLLPLNAACYIKVCWQPYPFTCQRTCRYGEESCLCFTSNCFPNHGLACTLVLQDKNGIQQKCCLQFPARKRTMSMGLIASSSPGQREERMDTEQAQLYNIQEDLPNSQFSSRPFLSNLWISAYHHAAPEEEKKFVQSWSR